MKKLLVALTGLVGLATSSVTTLSTEVGTKTELGPQATPKTWTFTEKNVEKKLRDSNGSDSNLYVAIDNINLTAMGINGLEGLHQYNYIEVPGLEVTYQRSGSPDVRGDTWGAKKRAIGSEDWFKQYEKLAYFNGWYYWRTLNTAATLWYSGNGNLMMRLAYKAELFSERGSHIDGYVAIKTGTEVKFY